MKLSMKLINKEKLFSYSCRQAIRELETNEREELFSYIENMDLETFSNIDNEDDTEYGVCDISCVCGLVSHMTCLTLNNEIIEFECLNHLAYILHGMSGAY